MQMAAMTPVRMRIPVLFCMSDNGQMPVKENLMDLKSKETVVDGRGIQSLSVHTGKNSGATLGRISGYMMPKNVLEVRKVEMRKRKMSEQWDAQQQ